MAPLNSACLLESETHDFLYSTRVVYDTSFLTGSGACKSSFVSLTIPSQRHFLWLRFAGTLLMLLHLQRSSVHSHHVRYGYHVLTEIFHC